jgi:hypothetical protein
MNFRNVFFFEAMLTPQIITIVYWLLLVFVLLAGLGSMFLYGFANVTFAAFIKGILITVGGGIGARIWCELLIVFFKINENIQKLADSK